MRAWPSPIVLIPARNTRFARRRRMRATMIAGEGGRGPYERMQAWITLAVAGLLEIVWAIGLKYADGFTKPLASAVTIAAMIASMWLLAQAARTLPIGTAYAVWTGIGAVGAALLGIMLFSESANAIRLGCIGLIVAGIVGLKVTSPS